MDFRSVTGLTIPAGSVNSIKIGNISVWSKSTENKYKILKNDEQVAKVTMSNFVKAVQSGDAQTDWGIGAQIVIPYTDPFDNNEYELPFNFGTFEAYGDGKLGLQAHYGVPSTMKRYGANLSSTNNADTFWNYSCFYSWFHNITTSNIAFSQWWGTTIPFTDCIPEDFAHAVNYTSFGGRNNKFFILGIMNHFFTNTLVTLNGKTYAPQLITGDDGSHIWEYWKNKLVTQKKFNDTHSSLKFRNVKSELVNIALPNPLKGSGTSTETSSSTINVGSVCMCVFSSAGKLTYSNFSGVRCCLPACVIG